MSAQRAILANTKKLLDRISSALNARSTPTGTSSPKLQRLAPINHIVTVAAITRVYNNHFVRVRIFACPHALITPPSLVIPLFFPFLPV
jgi:hypothetical protein